MRCGIRSCKCGGAGLPLIEDLFMKKSILVLAVFAASCSIANAKDLKPAVLTIAATQMTDAEMDTVTAGAANFQEKCSRAAEAPPSSAGQTAVGPGPSPSL